MVTLVVGFCIWFVMTLLSGLLYSGVLCGSSYMLQGVQLSLFGRSVESGVELGGVCQSMVVGVLIVFGATLIFMTVYMKDSVKFVLFMGVVSVFVWGVLVLLCGSSLYDKVVGWEVLGVTSFILIGFYSTRVSWGSALYTVLVNRVGDASFILIICWVVTEWSYGMNVSTGSWVLLLFLALALVMTKSSQYPFNGWLPLAMAAPTPVSALVHSSTLVIAGLYMGGLFYGYSSLQEWGVFSMSVASLTIWIAAVSAIYEQDFKKVVALSTSLHLGLMLVMLQVGGPIFMEGHMLFHAFYKSSLFIGVGMLILFLFHEQKYEGGIGPGGLFSGMWGWVIMTSVMSLSGLMGSSGWVTKDYCLEQLLSGGSGMVWSMAVYLSLALGFVYCIKLLLISVKSGSGSTAVCWVGCVSSVLGLVMIFMGSLGVCFGSWLGLGGLAVVCGVSTNGLVCSALFWSLGLFGCCLLWCQSWVGGESMFYMRELLGGLMSSQGFALKAMISQVEGLLSSSVVVVQKSGAGSVVFNSGLLGFGGDIWFLFLVCFLGLGFC